MHQRMLPAAQKTGILLGACLLPGLIGAPHPWAALLIITVGLLQYGAMQLMVPRFERPELVVFASFMVLQGFIMTGVLFAGRVPDGGLFVMLWPIIGFATRLPTRAVVWCTAWSLLLIWVGYIITDGSALLRDPAPLTVGFAIAVSASVLVSTLRNSDTANHSAAILDPLTGLENRHALEHRVDELEREHPDIAVVVLDLDEFKAINDLYGHDTGDEVLRGVAGRLAEHLRPEDALYRLGGEEFVALLPGVNAVQAAGITERLIGAVRALPVAGCDITVSAGVAAVAAGVDFNWRSIYRRADGALYAAKEGGRDQVRIAGLTGLPVPIAAAG